MYDAKVLIKNASSTDQQKSESEPGAITLESPEVKQIQGTLHSLYENMRLLRSELKKRTFDEEAAFELFDDFLGYSFLFFDMLGEQKKEEGICYVEDIVGVLKRAKEKGEEKNGKQ